MNICTAFISDGLGMFLPTLLVATAFAALAWELLRRSELLIPAGSTGDASGESLRQAMDHLHAKLFVRLPLTVGVALVVGMAVREMSQIGAGFPVVGVVFTGSAVSLALSLWTWQAIKDWWTTRVARETRRQVGGDLDLLMLDGCRVFHELKTDQVGRLDHVVISPHAVFLVDSPTFPAPAPDEFGFLPEVVHDGRALRFPTFNTSKPLTRVVRRARWLQRHIKRSTGLNLTVHPVLTLPGWSVRGSASGPVTVVNPESLPAAAVDKAAQPMYEAQRRQIINVLDAHQGGHRTTENGTSIIVRQPGLDTQRVTAATFNLHRLRGNVRAASPVEARWLH